LRDRLATKYGRKRYGPFDSSLATRRANTDHYPSGYYASLEAVLAAVGLFLRRRQARSLRPKIEKGDRHCGMNPKVTKTFSSRISHLLKELNIGIWMETKEELDFSEVIRQKYWITCQRKVKLERFRQTGVFRKWFQ
jgi:hypothetical protein